MVIKSGNLDAIFSAKPKNSRNSSFHRIPKTARLHRIEPVATKTMKKITDRAKKWKCVRFDDNNGFSTKFNKTNFPNESRREMYYYSVKCVEQVMRGLSLTFVATKKRFQKFRWVSEGLKLMLKPVGFQSFSFKEKRETVEKLIDKFDNELAAAMSRAPVQGVDTQADSSDDMQVGEGSGTDSAVEGVANTSLPPDDSLQNFLPGSVRSEGSPGVLPGFALDLGSTLSQLDNPEGRPPPSSRQCHDEINQSMSDMERRASRYPDMLSELKQQLILFENKLKDREMNERLSLESRSNLPRTSLEKIPSRLPEGKLAEDPQNQLSKASIENIETPMVHGKEDGFFRNRSISEALEVVPRLTGRLKKNEEDIRPEVYGGSADEDLPSKPLMHVSMEGFGPQASDLQVSDLCSGGENFMIMPNPGGNSTLQIVGIDRFVSAEPSADERDQWAEDQLCQFDMPFVESWTYLRPSPVRHVSIDTLPA